METDCMNDIRDHVHESLSALEKNQREQRHVAAVQQAASTLITKRDLMLHSTSALTITWISSSLRRSSFDTTEY